MIVAKELLRKQETRELVYFDDIPVFKCPYVEIDGLCVNCTDYTSEDVSYNTYCYNRGDCKFKNTYNKTPQDLKVIKNISESLKYVLPFGKMRGKTIQEVLDNSPGYLRWLLGVETYGRLANSLLLCSWSIIAKDNNKPCVPLVGWGSSDENYGYGHWDDYPQYY